MVLSAELSDRLTQVGPGTPMGTLLRRYWHPIAPVGEMVTTRVKPVRVLGEDLVLFRTAEGSHGLVSRSCPHRGADLSYGWVEGSALRCMYHGWAFDGSGACVAQPFEETIAPGSRFKASVRVTAYETATLGGLVWAYLGPAPAPPPPLYEPFQWDRGFVQVVFSEIPCNWFHCHENSVDPVHFEWLHINGTEAARNPDTPACGPTHTGITFDEFEHGIVATRRTDTRVRRSDLYVNGRPQETGLLSLWPNALFVGNHFEWRVPVDDTHTMNITWWYSPKPKDIPGPGPNPVPYWYGPIADPDTGRWITTYPMNQDIASWLGQGVAVDRTRERLGRSDVGIIQLRQMFLRELDRLERGECLVGLESDRKLGDVIRLPIGDTTRLTEGIDRVVFESDLQRKRNRLGDGQHYSFQAGQPEWVQRLYEEHMGIASP